MIDVLRAFPTILNLLEADSAAAEQIVFAAWRRSVDGAMAENVVPVRLHGKRLIAAVPSETWRRQVADLGPALAAKVNALLGTAFVSFVEFQVDPDAVEANRTRLVSEDGDGSDPSLPMTITPELRMAADAITDGPLRSIFLAAAGSSLARNERHAK